MADTQQPVVQPVEEQVTSKVPVTKQKNPKRVAAGKAIAEKTRIAREKQKKDLIEAQSIIALGKHADPPDPPALEPPSETKNGLTITQLLSVISIIVSLVGVYYKREEIKNVFAKKAAPPPLATPPSNVDVASKKAIRKMDD